MAFDYSLEVESPSLTLDGLLKALRGVGGPDAAAVDPDRGDPHLFWLHQEPAAIFEPDALGVQVIQDAYGVVPNLVIVVRLDKSDQGFNADALTRLTLRLLERTSAKAVLTFNGEIPILLCDDRGVVFNSEWQEWDLSAFPTTFSSRIESLPVA